MANEIDAYETEKRCIHELFAVQAKQRPDAIALRCENLNITYAELELRSNQLAQYLQKLGVGQESYVSILIERSADLVVGLLGILKAGGAYAPLDPRCPADRLAFMMKDTQAPVLLTQQSLVDTIATCGSVNTVCIDKDWKAISREATDCPALGIDSTNLAYVNFTSGSTGQPKGVEVPHRGVTRLVRDTNYVNFGPDEVFMHFAPITFDAATFEIWGCLLNGGELAIVPNQLPTLRQLGQFIQTRGVTTLWLSAGLFHKMVEHNLESFAGVRQLLTGGDVVSVRHAKAYLQQVGEGRLINGYGPTENTTFTTCYSMSAVTTLGKSVPIGKPIANTQVYLLDQNLQPVPPGEAGELYAGGCGLARGYLNHRELTDEKFIRNPFADSPGDRLYKTGDMARYLPDGNIEFLGRVDDQVKVRGFRIELEEIRTILNQHPAVQDSIVTASDDLVGERQLVAYAVPDRERLNGDHQGGDDRKHVDDWRMLYDQLYNPSDDVANVDFNLVGWESSYTGQPLSCEEMQEWVDHTVSRILSLKPQRVLEIGCGTGLLLFRVAPHCADYLGTDLSPVVIQDLRTKLAQNNLPQVRLESRPAENFGDIAAASFDTVILNSVVQYFPTIDYLQNVLESAVQCVSAGGSIFVGDVRSLPLLKAFHAAVQLHKASADTPLDLLKQRIHAAQMQEDELVIAPSFFAALKTKIARIQHVEVRPKRGRFPNEMSQFRYDVVLHVGDTAVQGDRPRWIDWNQENLTLAQLRNRLDETAGGDPIGIRNIHNGLVSDMTTTVELLEDLAKTETVRSVDEQLQSRRRERASPEDICCLGASLGYDVQLSWLQGRSDGAFDAAFCDDSQALPLIDFADRNQDRVMPAAEPATRPAVGKATGKLSAELQRYAIQRLPDYMVPSFFLLVESLPLNPNGKIDRKALPRPDFELGRLSVTYEPPRDDLERTLADIWQEAIGVQPIGIHDNFFDLGGSSLLAAEVFHKIGTHFKREFPLAILAKQPTIEALAQVLRREDESTSWSSLVPIQTLGDKTPLFCVHGGLGNVLTFRKLSQLLGDEQPLYGLQWNGLDGSSGHRSIEVMASDYIGQIRTVQPHGPYLLAGHCVGGITAYEMAQQLLAAGEEVALLAMMDTPNIKSDTFRPSVKKALKVKIRWILGEPLYGIALAGSALSGRRLTGIWARYGKARQYTPNPVFSAVVSACLALGRRVPPGFRQVQAVGSMLAAVRRYWPRTYSGRIVFFYAGTEKVRQVMGFSGHLIDGMYGWSPTATENFEFHAIAGAEHDSIVTGIETAELLAKCLEEAHGSIDAK